MMYMYLLQVVTLDFNYFVTQSTYDLVYIYDGDNVAAPLIATLSGSYTTPPRGYRTSQQYMLVRFTSNSASNFRGFSAVYRSSLTGR